MVIELYHLLEELILTTNTNVLENELIQIYVKDIARALYFILNNGKIDKHIGLVPVNSVPILI